MPSLKEYRNRIASVKSTRKITSAMKMVAASKLKKAQESAEASQPYAHAMDAMLARLSAGLTPGSGPKLMTGTGRDDVHLLVVVSADRGLCGGFNAGIVRAARQEIERRERDGKTVKVVCVGRKARDVLRRQFKDRIIESFTGFGGKTRLSYHDASEIGQYVLDLFEDGGFDRCVLLYNEFRSILLQRPKSQVLIPFGVSEDGASNDSVAATDGANLVYAFEPDEDKILARLLPQNVNVQIFRALLDSAAGEQAARMTAMDNATRNAGDMINRLSIQYNRARQAYITKELIEIISGAEAV